MTAAAPRRLLVVCLGNICRSPLGAAVLSRRGGAGVEVRSAGIRDKHVGRPAHPLMAEVAAARGYDLSAHQGRQVTAELITWADSVLAMDRAVLASLHQLAAAPNWPNLRLYLDGQDVPDPYGSDRTVFDQVAALIETGASQHL
ncbi:low molecular weight protein-tyrosine-phosphatase [Streptomyces sp. NPDC002144]